jgi:hypothetical protein
MLLLVRHAEAGDKRRWDGSSAGEKTLIRPGRAEMLTRAREGDAGELPVGPAAGRRDGCRPQLISAVMLATGQDARRNSLAFLAGAALAVTVGTLVAYGLFRLVEIAARPTSKGTVGTVIDWLVVALLLVLMVRTSPITRSWTPNSPASSRCPRREPPRSRPRPRPLARRRPKEATMLPATSQTPGA